MSQYDPNGWQYQPGGNQPYGGQPSGYGASQGGSGYPQGQYPQGGYPQGGFPGVQPEAPSATTALICGILGFFCIIPAVMGVVYGTRSRPRGAGSAEPARGRRGSSSGGCGSG